MVRSTGLGVQGRANGFQMFLKDQVLRFYFLAMWRIQTKWDHCTWPYGFTISRSSGLDHRREQRCGRSWAWMFLGPWASRASTFMFCIQATENLVSAWGSLWHQPWKPLLSISTCTKVTSLANSATSWKWKRRTSWQIRSDRHCQCLLSSFHCFVPIHASRLRMPETPKAQSCLLFQRNSLKSTSPSLVHFVVHVFMKGVCEPLVRSISKQQAPV